MHHVQLIFADAAGEIGLRQRRALVRQERLFADDDDVSVEAELA
jgi:hypothetical protein